MIQNLNFPSPIEEPPPRLALAYMPYMEKNIEIELSRVMNRSTGTMPIDCRRIFNIVKVLLARNVSFNEIKITLQPRDMGILYARNYFRRNPIQISAI